MVHKWALREASLHLMPVARNLLLFGIPVRYRHAAISAEGAARYFYACGGLATFVFCPVYELDYAPDVVFFEAGVHDLGYSHVFFDVGFQDGVKDIVWWKGVRVALIFAQFGARFFVQDGVGDDLAVHLLVEVSRHAVDHGLGHVFYDRETACGVAVEGRVAHAHLALVAGGKDDPTELVGESHEDVAPDAALQVLLGNILGQAFERLFHHLPVGVEGWAYGYGLGVYAQVLGQRGGIGVAQVGGVAARHEDAGDVLGTKGLDGHGGRQGGVDAAGEAKHRPREPVLAEVVPEAQHQPFQHLALLGERWLYPRLDRLRGGRPVGGNLYYLGGALGVLLAGPGIVEALHERLVRIQVHEQEFFPELGSPRHERALRIEDHRMPVEDELVLAAHEIAEHDVATVIRSSNAEHTLSEGALASVVGGGRDVQEHAGSRECLFVRRSARVPDVLAHAHPDEVAIEVHERRSRTLPEVAVLVEDTVVGEVMLVVAVQDLAPREHGAGVVQVSVEVDEADGGHHVLRNLPGELAESPHILLDKARAHQEVLGRIAGDGQLGIGDEIRA